MRMINAHFHDALEYHKYDSSGFTLVRILRAFFNSNLTGSAQEA